MSKKIAILQSNYIPWKGYFDLINRVDEFIIYDEVQYTKRDWRNRNRIKTPQGLKWLSVPVENGPRDRKISEVEIGEAHWAPKHAKSLRWNYSRAAHFDEVMELVEPMYEPERFSLLSHLNLAFIELVNRYLGIDTRIRQSSEFDLLPGRTEKLIGICKQCGADEYVSGPSARDYFDMKLAEEAGIKVTWMDYSGYPEYRQLYPPFEHGVTVLDLLFNEGPNASDFMKSFKGGA